MIVVSDAGRDVAFMIPAEVIQTMLGLQNELMDKGLVGIALEEPGGRMSVDSPFYVLRSPGEERAFQEMMKPGALIRIKAPHEFGKSSLMGRVVAQAEALAGVLSVRTVAINFREIDRGSLENLRIFLQHFCAQVTYRLGLENHVKRYWDSGLGDIIVCGEYFESYLLPQIAGSLVLELDEVDVLFEGKGERAVAMDFFSMLRTWFEKRGQANGQWKKLRLVLVHSKDIDQETLEDWRSPFNVGTEIKLEEFDLVQVVALAERHGLGVDVAKQLMALVGGHPQLVRLGLYGIASKQVTFAQLLEDGATDGGFYGDHLRRMQRRLRQKDEQVRAALRRVLASSEGVTLDLGEKMILQGLGLVKFDRHQVRITCELYRQYFSNVLGV
jgi:hypothetical protein